VTDLNPIPVNAPELTTAPGVVVPPGCELIGGNLWMHDNRGRLVRRELVKAADLIEDEMVRKVMAFAEALSAQIARFKQHTFDDIVSHIALLDQEYGVAKGGVKGNLTLTRFDGLAQIQLQVAEQIKIGPSLQQAKSLVDECLTEWSSNAPAALQTIVQGAFDVDKLGHVRPTKLFALLRYDIADERWQRAMKAIRDSMRPEGTKEYVRFYRRADHKSKFENVTINLAAA
jgi:hypothetical protein